MWQTWQNVAARAELKMATIRNGSRLGVDYIDLVLIHFPCVAPWLKHDTSFRTAAVPQEGVIRVRYDS